LVLTPDAGAEGRLRARLPRTWYALFAHHPSLRPVQREGIPPLLDGHEVLLCAPTAGGKTEALVAAALEHAGTAVEHGPSVVYVCPTRALVNDVHRRLGPIAHRLHLRVGRHTADHRPDKDRLPHLLVTTPEGLDSRLCRHPGTLRDVRWLLLDELHLVAGTARGDQLAALAAPYGSVWIGLTDDAVEGTFAWIDGTPLTFERWWVGEPNDSGGEDSWNVRASSAADGVSMRPS
jgi:ATP-dependent Lhr-like helicase